MLGLWENRSMVTVFPTYFHRFAVPYGTCEFEPNESSVLLETLSR